MPPRPWREAAAGSADRSAPRSRPATRRAAPGAAAGRRRGAARQPGRKLVLMNSAQSGSRSSILSSIIIRASDLRPSWNFAPDSVEKNRLPVLASATSLVILNIGDCARLSGVLLRPAAAVASLAFGLRTSEPREPCKAPAVRGWTVCRFHGARGGGPRGKRNGMFKHGLYTK